MPPLHRELSERRSTALDRGGRIWWRRSSRSGSSSSSDRSDTAVVEYSWGSSWTHVAGVSRAGLVCSYVSGTFIAESKLHLADGMFIAESKLSLADGASRKAHAQQSLFHFLHFKLVIRTSGYCEPWDRLLSSDVALHKLNTDLNHIKFVFHTSGYHRPCGSS